MNGKPFIPSNSPYPGSSGSTSRAASTQASATNGVAGTCQITASDGGPVTGTLTWSGGSANTPAPSAAIVMETSTATWGGTVGDSPPFTFSADPTAGLGSGVIVVSSDSGQFRDPDGYGFSDSKTYTGIKYSAATSGSGSTTTCSPNFVLSGTTGINSDSYEYCALQYNYFLAGLPLTINLTNTIPENNATGTVDILPGQGTTASLVGVPANFTVNYQWAVDGTTFQSWVASRSSAVLSRGLGPTINPTAHWYWSDVAAYYNVTCTATIQPPAGQGNAFQEVVTQKVHLVVPTVTEMPTLGRVQINSHGPVDYQPYVALYAGGLSTPTTQTYGIIFNTRVTTPTPFTNSGVWNLVQLVTPTEETYPSTLNPNDGAEGCDSRYPYDPVSGYPYSANGITSQAGDDPGIPHLLDTITYYNVSDNFRTFVMFNSDIAGSDNQWVPLWQVGWNWNAQVTIPGVSWSLWNDATDAGIIRVGASAGSTTHPEWRLVH